MDLGFPIVREFSKCLFKETFSSFDGSFLLALLESSPFELLWPQCFYGSSKDEFQSTNPDKESGSKALIDGKAQKTANTRACVNFWWPWKLFA